MRTARKSDHNERLMNRMADRNGADLALAQQVGLFSPEEYRDANVACHGCASVAACEQHLERGGAGVPDFCRNGETLTRLSGEMDALGMSKF